MQSITVEIITMNALAIQNINIFQYQFSISCQLIDNSCISFEATRLNHMQKHYFNKIRYTEWKPVADLNSAGGWMSLQKGPKIGRAAAAGRPEARSAVGHLGLGLG